MNKPKYRAWFNTKPSWANQMFYSCEERLLGDWLSECEIHMNETDGGEFLQFTGLKDKNGKEIYEGDILDGSKFPDESCPSFVIFENGSFRRKYKEWPEFQPCPTINKHEISILDDIVIGNIHENPELLK